MRSALRNRALEDWTMVYGACLWISWRIEWLASSPPVFGWQLLAVALHAAAR